MQSTATNVQRLYAESGKAYRAARHPDPDDVAKMSQKALAAAVGKNRRHIIRIENGENRPMPRLRNRIADVLGVERSTLPTAADAPPFRKDSTNAS